jgi:hypothetical protein
MHLYATPSVICICKRAPRVLSYVDEGVGTLNSRPLRRDRHGAADVYIGFKPALAFLGRMCEPKNKNNP